MSASQKRAKSQATQAAKLQAGLLAAKGAPRNSDAHDGGTELQERPEQSSTAAEPSKTVRADDIFYGKGAATAATFRPWYWSYERQGEQDGTPPHDKGAPAAEAPPADVRALQERLAVASPAVTAEPAAPSPTLDSTPPPEAVPVPESAAQDHVTSLAAESTLESTTSPDLAPMPESAAQDQVTALAAESTLESTTSPDLAPMPESAAQDQVTALAAESTLESTTPPDLAPMLESAAQDQLTALAADPTLESTPSPDLAPMPESVAPDQDVAFAAEPMPAEAAVAAPVHEAPIETPPPVPEARPERPHERARRLLREQAAAAKAAAAAPPPKRGKAKPAEDDHAAARAAEERAAALAEEERAALAAEEQAAALAAEERATALAEEERIAALAEEERLAAARLAAEAAPATEEELAATIEKVMNRRRYTDHVEPEKAARTGSGHTITGSSLLAELQAAREARGADTPRAAGESDAAASTASSRPLLDRVLALGGIALILVVAFLALSPAAQYAPVARLTHFFN